MVVAKVLSGAPVGFESRIIEVESDATRGLPNIQIVGLANKSVDEAKERIKSAILNSLLEYPSKRITINLAPAELPKEGTHYDLPIALAVLISSGQLRQHEVDNALFAGELALDGSLRSIHGAIVLAEAAKAAHKNFVYLPIENVAQAQLVEGVTVIGIKTLKDLFLHLRKEQPLQSPTRVSLANEPTPTREVSLDDIRGQEQAKRALIIAAAGRHNILFTGPPGSGKTMLAHALMSLLPELTPLEQIAVTKLHSLSGNIVDTVIKRRPFRSPHHTASRTSLIGGGSHPQPGEISLAHLGVLFLDEMPEYPRSTLEALRQPLEDRQILITRAQGRYRYPADFMLVGTMNPCPCGYFGDSQHECTCTSIQILNYQKRLSGPLLDRIDLVVAVSRVPNSQLFSQQIKMSNKQQVEAQTHINLATIAQHDRYKSSNKYNSNLSNYELSSYLQLSESAHSLLKTAAEKLQLTARGYFRLIKVARTIADLEQSPSILPSHISEALQYR